MKSLRLLLDQMLDADVAGALTNQGHDVTRLSELDMSRADDDAVLSRAIHEDRILVTLDEHFGDWAVLPLSKHPGVLRVKANPATTQNILDVLLPFLAAHGERAMNDNLVIIKASGSRWIQSE